MIKPARFAFDPPAVCVTCSSHRRAEASKAKVSLTGYPLTQHIALLYPLLLGSFVCGFSLFLLLFFLLLQQPVTAEHFSL